MRAPAEGIDTGPDGVPGSFLLATADDVIVGRTSIRPRLNDWLLAFGGHTGYGVLDPDWPKADGNSPTRRYWIS